MDYVCALDAGTTGVRAIAVDASGRPFAQCYREFTQHFPRPGWVEHDATEIAEAIIAVTVELIGAVGAAPLAFGITNQRETVVAWDRRSGAPLHRAIVWQDRRGADRCEALRADHYDLIRTTTGLVPDPYFSATKLEWLFTTGGVASGPEVAVGTIDTWLLWGLTGGQVHATEPSNASRTMLFDIATMSWSPELCELFGVPAHVLPDVVETSGRFGTTRDVTGIPDGIPISGIAGDQQAALFGQACFEPGMAKNTYGTGSFVLLNTGESLPEPTDGLLTTVAWQLCDAQPVYAVEGSIFSTGSAVQWLRDGLGIITAADDLEGLALSCDDAGGVVVVPAFTGLGAPWWDPSARGTITGLTRGSGRAQLARAVIDAMVFQTRDVVDAMTAATGRELTELRVDGGAAVMDLLCQDQADQLATPVVRAADVETTALGAAFLAGLAEGFWSGPDHIADLLGTGTRFDPSGVPDDEAFTQWHRAVQRSRDFA
ncbi:MAG TPA: glycerol kinase [Acidimicrobiales bacterium]|nr:glycerol kinase [Acidimicrobiales bacterium]